MAGAPTSVGVVGGGPPSTVDDVGTLTPAGAAWTCEWWIGGDDRWHLPTNEVAVRQQRIHHAAVVETAMRVPAILPKYCLSICSGDFNEWVGKNVSVDFRGSYMFSGEYEMPELDLGTTFNYAEMAYLIAPRPFMVARGHDDGVGIDEMIAYEFAKVRYLYENKLKLRDQTEIEWFVGGHEIHSKGTFAFLKKHLK